MEEIVRRYLAVFVSGDVAELADLVAPDVVIHDAGTDVQGRHHVDVAVHQDGLSCAGIDVHELLVTASPAVGSWSSGARPICTAHAPVRRSHRQAS